MNLALMFYGTVFVAFGLGIEVYKSVGDNMGSGFYYIILGIILFILNVFFWEKKNA